MDFFDIVAKDGSSPAISCLNFEPSVSKFPSISSHLVATNVLATIKNRFLFFRDRMGVRMRCGFFLMVVTDSGSHVVSYDHYYKNSFFIHSIFHRNTITLP